MSRKYTCRAANTKAKPAVRAKVRSTAGMTRSTPMSSDTPVTTAITRKISTPTKSPYVFDSTDTSGRTARGKYTLVDRSAASTIEVEANVRLVLNAVHSTMPEYTKTG